MNLPLPYQEKRAYAQDVLTKAVGRGQLDLGTYSQLVGDVWATDDPAEIDRIVQSVAVVPTHQQFPTYSTVEPQQRHIAVFGERKVTGRITLPAEISTVNVFGETKLDFRQARISQQETVINVFNLFGEVKLIVPKGVAVSSSAVSIFAEEKLRSEQPANPSVPRIHLRGLNLFGEVIIRS